MTGSNPKGVFTVKSSQASVRSKAGSATKANAERRKLVDAPAQKKRLRSPWPYVYCILAIVVVFGGYRGWQLNWPDRARHTVTQTVTELALAGTSALGFRAETIVFSGIALLDPQDLQGTLGLSSGMPIFAVDLDDIQMRLSENSWIKSATVMRRLPDRLIIAVEERSPIARWQINGSVSVIDEDGQKLAADHRAFRNLPFVVGEGANTSAHALISALQYAPQMSEKIYAAQHQGNRRWDLLLVNDLVVRLPESNLEDALRQAEALIIKQDLYHKDIQMVDMRNPSAPVLQTSAEFVAARRAQFNQQINQQGAN